ncbi:unnamed protein product [Protopolystoma xenopodis]|uniref:Uncharacterized protein n=1 Tax=Protopolystoma xenopodis TaxID=117903 RepID=A0A448X5N4_9PLAT|nr:unnamed protein product [Protopolystoma xenopodis]
MIARSLLFSHHLPRKTSRVDDNVDEMTDDCLDDDDRPIDELAITLETELDRVWQNSSSFSNFISPFGLGTFGIEAKEVHGLPDDASLSSSLTSSNLMNRDPPWRIWLARQQRHRVAVYFERLCRLISTPGWHDCSTIRSRVSHLIMLFYFIPLGNLCYAEMCPFYQWISFYHIISYFIKYLSFKSLLFIVYFTHADLSIFTFRIRVRIFFRSCGFQN